MATEVFLGRQIQGPNNGHKVGKDDCSKSLIALSCDGYWLCFRIERNTRRQISVPISLKRYVHSRISLPVGYR